eukprot:CAMPEP_0177729994 /NCGR_PEP_ID=MMETSP0484_2-20121128/21742_1 /TAXON_ID=354590 /ORGANISM="Rhodomonas lens, Strain RHODO" /LENGTH=146 /DNA_ID=CAMNT_0019242933 /DNA_START=17 /DNA_END=457 /DNA_ORIENTATION=-
MSSESDCETCGVTGECNIATDASDFIVQPHQYCGIEASIHYCCPFEHKGDDVECSTEAVHLCKRFIGTVSWTTIAAIVIPVFVVVGLLCLWYQHNLKKKEEATTSSAAHKHQDWVAGPTPNVGMQPMQYGQPAPMYGQAYPQGGYA